MDSLQDCVIPRWTLIQACQFCEKPIYFFPKDQPVESCPRCGKAGARLAEFNTVHAKLNEFLKARCYTFTVLHAAEKLSELEPDEFKAAEMENVP